MPVKFTKGNDQRGSPFFTKLLPETRRLIFMELFGKFVRDGHPKARCQVGSIVFAGKANMRFHIHITNIRINGATCRLTFCSPANGRRYESGICVLYGTNTFIFGQGQHDFLLPFKATVGKHFDLIKKLDLYSTVGLHQPVLGPKLLSYALAQSEHDISVHARYIEDPRQSPQFPSYRFTRAFSFLEFNPGTFVHFYLPGQLRDYQPLTMMRSLTDLAFFTFTNTGVDFDWESPESDDEMYGFHVFPSRGDF
ncbi:hypothetical protein FALBO_15133 [Fusarium albosuccineum]|uniref:Uncharacterized protein n=1 Tax=Fusarium albosuccineum TaxID=1237068 RepID=A0A8H4KY76_9HYPO|nr:hypothetical protein FALBO_15133 [Fusarium albosuccineum]